MKHREPYIDFLKAIAILLVILGHTGGYKLNNIIGLVGKNSFSGVIVFFIISGYLSYYSFQKQNYNNKEQLNHKKGLSWIVRKIIRIIPVYYLSLAIGVLLGGYKYWLGAEKNVSLTNLIMHFLFVNGLVPHYSNSIIGVEWYISDLVLFWFIVPMLNKGFKRSSRVILICVLAFIFSFVLESVLRPIRWDVDQYIFDQFICYTMPIKQLLYFLIGFAWAKMKQESCFWREYAQKSHNPIINGLSLGIFSFFIYIVISLTEIDTILFGGYLYLSTAWVLAFASLQLYYPNLVICRILSVLGRYSLGIYLFHLPINDAYVRQFGEPTGTTSWLIQYMFVVLISYLVSLVVMNGITKVFGIVKNSIKMRKISNDKTRKL